MWQAYKEAKWCAMSNKKSPGNGSEVKANARQAERSFLGLSLLLRYVPPFHASAFVKLMCLAVVTRGSKDNCVTMHLCNRASSVFCLGCYNQMAKMDGL